MIRAVVVGAAGQDGTILRERLREEGASVVALDRPERVRDLPDGSAVDLLDRERVRSLVARTRPDEVYYLAAHHGSSEEDDPTSPGDLYEASHAVHVTGLLQFLEAIRTASPATRLVYAASSRVFGQPASARLDETTALAPVCAYGITKACGLLLCRLYRATHGIHASAGILFNHESPLRPPQFVSQRIVRGAAAIVRGETDRLVLGDLSARADWGYAPDFVDAMVRIARHRAADEFVVATGEGRSVRDFVEVVFRLAGLDVERHVIEDPSRLAGRPSGTVGDAAKLRAATGWAPSVSFEEMAEVLWRAAGADPGAH